MTALYCDCGRSVHDSLGCGVPIPGRAKVTKLNRLGSRALQWSPLPTLPDEGSGSCGQSAERREGPARHQSTRPNAGVEDGGGLAMRFGWRCPVCERGCAPFVPFCPCCERTTVLADLPDEPVKEKP